ncbi:helix-turn-helix transcriptional regulator [Microbispora sp. NBC_01189]|uniref:helix-turn-helix transcriptional regulator n=1 Tax=Microbispora sp. NBC_01189 TaxID=2903583 RepID=UPI002E154E7F|nr:helix-turn-helix transcriptional regulator [Microbispora sp. NBC_01189]
MEEICREAVERSITMMWNHYSEPLSLDDIADSAKLSKFYFSRIFRSVTGTSPGRFLSAIRIYSAKRLLLDTSLSVTDITYMVGYNSLGTFTTRFRRSVGVTPARFRTLFRGGPPSFPPFAGDSRRPSGAVHGMMVLPPSNSPLRVYVGVFSSPIVEGMPVSCDIIDSSADCCRLREYRLASVPVGEWYVRAVAIAVCGAGLDPRPWARPGFVGDGRPFAIRAGEEVEIDIPMRDMDLTDLPILLALPELDQQIFPGHRPIVQPRPELASGRRNVI